MKYPPPPLIETPAQLETLCRRLRQSPWLALDTEFHRERTYRPTLCLLQVAVPGLCACIDTLRLGDLTPLLEILHDPARTKVFHSAVQDLEVLYGLDETPLRPLFDTQVAAPLLGYRDQLGYGDLVAALLGIRLTKSQTRTDWRRRPLSPEQLAYAADDVVYLARLYPLMRDALRERGRLDWLDEDFERLSDPARYRPDPEAAWLRFKNGRFLPPAQQAALRLLAAWRERRAEAENRPRGWILRDDLLLAIAREQPASRERLARLCADQNLGDAALNELLALLAPLSRDDHAGFVAGFVQAPAPRRPSAQELAQVRRLQAHLRHRCREAGIEPRTVTGRRELERLVRGEQGLRVCQGWRRHFIGEELLAMAGQA